MASLLVLMVAVAPAGAQESSPPDQGEKTATTLTVGKAAAAAGDPVVAPVYFTPAEGVQVAKLDIDVTFVSANLKFDKVESGIATEMGKVDLRSEARTEKNEKGVETTVVSMHLSAPVQKAIPGGLLAYLMMRINKTGRPAVISLRTKAKALELGSQQALNNLRVTAGEVEVVAPGEEPNVICFFFSH